MAAQKHLLHGGSLEVRVMPYSVAFQLGLQGGLPTQLGKVWLPLPNFHSFIHTWARGVCVWVVHRTYI